MLPKRVLTKIIYGMKILIVSQYYYPEKVSLTAMAEGLVKRGHDVLVVTGQPNYGLGHIQEGYENIFDEEINGVRVHRCKLFPRGNSGVSRLRNYISFWRNSKKYLGHLKEEFDVVYSQVMSPITAASGANLYAKKHHVPHVHHCYDLWPESTVVTGAVRKNSCMYRLLFSWSKKIYRKMDHILISTPSFESYFRDVLKIKDTPITYVAQPALLAKETGKPIEFDTPYSLVYAGNVGPLQLVENLVKAMPLVKTKGVKLHVIGMGHCLEKVKDIVKEKHLEEVVEIHGPLSREITSSYFINATALVVSLKGEGFVGATVPNKLVSSLYYGRPVLGVIKGDGEKILKEADAAVFSDSEKEEDIALAIDNLLSLSEEERKTLGNNGKEYYEKVYDFDLLLDKIVEMLCLSIKERK